MFINFSLLFVGAIKARGHPDLPRARPAASSGASWGIMISQAKSEVVQGFFWQIGTATLFMFILVLAFNILSDALQDAFDPKHVG
jgi:peptide/nickel transport system permease protein